MSIIKFLDPLPILEVVQPKAIQKGVPFYEIVMKPTDHSYHSMMPGTYAWTYESQVPGPIIEVNRGQPIRVKWVNQLPSKHFLPLDHTVHGAGEKYPEVRTVVHVHGGRTPSTSDGDPDAWFTKGYERVGPFFSKEIYEYPNDQQATMLWYHDHAIGITRLNIYAGLAGIYIIRDEHEKSLSLPDGKYEIPLVIQDKSFHRDGSLYYPTKPKEDPVDIDPSVVPEFFGDTNVVNGKIWPYLEVEPRKYRFRMVNAANSRYYRMKLSHQESFIQIGTDQGLLAKPVYTNVILIGPGERADVIIDFSKQKGNRLVLTNDAPSPFPDGDQPDPKTTGTIMQIRVNLPLKGKDERSIPVKLSQISKLKEEDAAVIRNFTLDSTHDLYGRHLMLLDNKRWTDPVMVQPILGTTEIWTMLNLTEETHPIHLHLVKFQVLDRQAFDVDQYKKNKTLEFTGVREIPEAQEQGWKDVVNAHPGEVTRIITTFEPYLGRYVWHCHILEHEDHEMMLPYDVIAPRSFLKRIIRGLALPR